ncbi:MAG: glycosyltransferase family 2 protein [Lachnospiraceae bacterium]|nr:glycosyltransferase family 2 protein [Lachnospiraceae bacterium]
MSRVSVVIPNYNGLVYLKQCLRSLKEQTDKDFEIIVVDNGSTEEGFKECMQEFQKVKWILHEQNGGFSFAVNQGIAASSGEFVILLNNDTTVDNAFVSNLVRSMESHPDAFSVQALMVSMKDSERIDDAGDLFTIFGWSYARGKGKKVSSYSKPVRIFSSCAGAAIYRKSIFDEIGLFDENHFAYLEDVDIGYRARLYGYKNYYEPKAVVMHAGSASSGSRYNEFKIRLAAKNSIYLIYKNQPLWQRICLFPWHFCGIVIKQLFFIRKGYGKVYHDAVAEGLHFIRTSGAKEHKVKFHAANHRNAFLLGLEQFFALFRILFSA